MCFACVRCWVLYVDFTYLDPGSIVLSIRGCDCCQLISTVDAELAAVPGRSKAGMLLFFIFFKILAFILTPSFTALRVTARWPIRHYWVSTSDWIEICRVIDQSADIIEWNCRCHRATAAGAVSVFVSAVLLPIERAQAVAFWCCQHALCSSIHGFRQYLVRHSAILIRRRQQHRIDFNP